MSELWVSSMVIANDYRQPVVTRDGATIDISSEGHFELGIGTGCIEKQCQAAGINYDGPMTRVDRFEEAIAVIEGCWSGEPCTYSGRAPAGHGGDRSSAGASSVSAAFDRRIGGTTHPQPAISGRRPFRVLYGPPT